MGAFTKAGNLSVFGKPKEIKPSTGGQIAILTESGSVHELDAIYPALGCDVRSELTSVLGASCTETGNLVVDDHPRTSVRGLYAAGDVVSDLHQLSVAFGHAALAATAIQRVAVQSAIAPRQVTIVSTEEVVWAAGLHVEWRRAPVRRRVRGEHRGREA
jgi:pyruvate/2-oxoglutarate dehydrogenase complex dihydrolipoamide dehydrogenase (E3) component